ncbi:polyprenyl diphosphate synthase [Campylobacter sp. LH-2024]|uniref:Di-trans,poly-cis-decaprenylcistransferase n=1 Tax=Campylobacter molothri TaxID=1032242 RepID=A0ACC5VYS9_9BACT|nr:polyprenyl diphosphate synthase [Campylobacter sp. 2018MI35]MBZ7928048.1 di-trans,poly-cis-decaprenylcistransferase [Campylobacter sp. RM10542]MBZ7930696.1 di-trans,poly-cis-decaprenylcistransferase [Campylobacter sp. RM12910]MBZ7933699.1 di-trans,poly-cis-decaprenylcistransferase [Campylobacter sp. W0065]MBZ7937087.1 di-trans,poly-cis-decaprenylcistransferase [Campylobacter sp. RM10538]MBZ7940318.1 di-trans,poly-cis-decaprenylcistransferase [Campylobacter sp. W0047]MBZ7943097.1 di-trans,p
MNDLKHLAIVMDGNRRWAKAKGFLAKLGYSQGVKTMQKLMEACVEEGVSNLSLFAFSTENWNRPKDEIEFIFELLDRCLNEALEKFEKNNVRLRAIGDLTRLDQVLRDKIALVEEATKHCDKLCVNLAISYGAKDEIVRATRRVIEKGLEINEKNISDNLDLPLDVDLMLRVGNAKRLSNFLLWQCAYAEIYFSETLFPSLTKREFKKIIKEYRKRERTFGR